MVAITAGVLLTVGILWAIGLSAVALGFILDRMLATQVGGRRQAVMHSVVLFHRRRA